MRRGVKLRDENGGCWEIEQVSCGDGTVLVAETIEHLQHILCEFERACESMRLKINVGKSKVLIVKKDQTGSWYKVRMNGEEM